MAKSVEEYTKEIEELKLKNRNTFDSLEEQATILLEKSIELLKDRIKYEVEYNVKNNPVHTKELAEQGKLKEMKEAMNQLLEEVSQHTTIAMSQDKVFIHRTLKPDRNKHSYEYKSLVEGKYKEAYRIIIGLAGELLNKFGYIKVGNDYNGHSEWKYISGSGGKIKYGYSINISMVEDDWKKYNDKLEKFVDGLMKYQSLTDGKEETEAMNLWESV